jgi:hypothetical protein
MSPKKIEKQNSYRKKCWMTYFIYILILSHSIKIEQFQFHKIHAVMFDFFSNSVI